MEVGVHALNQIVYGWLLGIWTLAMCINWIDPMIYYYWKNIRQNDESRSFFNFGTVLSFFQLCMISFVFLVMKSKNYF
jgi:hypothetical protein